MSLRLHPSLVVGLVLALCGALIFGLAFFRARRTASAEALLAHLPAEEGIVLAVDFAALRQSGILAGLAGSSVAQEPEYQAFVLETGFDYQQDLDYVAAWFRRGTTCLLLRGRFDWPRLRAYVASQDGVCRNAFCRLQGSAPNRKISFFPMGRDVMALAVGPDEWAATLLATEKPQRRAMRVPGRSVWLLFPSSILQSTDSYPAGARPFAKAVQSAEKIVVSLVIGARLEVELDATCRSPQDAAGLGLQLEEATRLVKETMMREGKTPSPEDLSGMLVAGTFTTQGPRVVGRWPVGRDFLKSILGDTQ